MELGKLFKNIKNFGIMNKLTAADLVKQIAQLGTHQVYEYVSGKSRLAITQISSPDGPIKFNNIDANGIIERSGSISTQMLAKMALVCSTKPNFPLHVDRIYSAGGNSRSALETLLAYTPHFFICYPDRIEPYSGEILQNLKHIMWCPDEAHPLGELAQKEYHEIITEIEIGVDFGTISLSPMNLGTEFETIEAKRTHTQMQIALIEIGNALNFHTWIAKNDRSIQVGNKTLGEFEGVIASLDDVSLLYNQDIKESANFIDCIWFTQDGKRIPAVIEIEHSTGVTSGMTRMRKFYDTAPSIAATFTVVAPNNLRNKVVSEANQPIFRDLDIRYMPYTTIRELYGLIQRYSLKDVVDYKFVKPFMERVVEN